MNSFTQAHSHQSPLFMAMNDPVLHQLISYLTAKKNEQEKAPHTPVRIELGREFIAEVREAFRQNILDGERHLHILSHLLASILLEDQFELHSNVIGVLPGGDSHPFLIRERISREKLFSATDIDLGNHLMDNFRYNRDGEWVQLHLSANFIEYLPVGRPSSHVNRITSRVKAEEELCNKIVDEIFSLDELVSRDKHLRQYSKYVKDIFGIKIVCDDEPSCYAVHDRIQKITMDAPELMSIDGFVVPLPSDGRALTDRLLELVETKDYLNCDPVKMKKTGWRALKSVTRWNGKLFEIQVQPLANYYLELDHMSGQSHRSFKINRDFLRDEVAKHIPMYGFYRALLKMIFVDNDDSFEFENASVAIV